MKRKNTLARTLLKKSSGVDNPLCEAIDDACREGEVFGGSFSIKNIRKNLGDLGAILDSDEFDRDKFFSTFFSLYSSVMSPDKRATGVFHPSQLLGGCPRAFYYEISKTPPSDSVPRNIGASLQRTFDVGTWYHLYIQSILHKIGLLEKAEVPVENPAKYLSGHADGVINASVYGERVLLEIKTMNSWTFQKAAFRPFRHHEFQASLYARELGIEKVLYLYINKDTSEIREFLRPLNTEQLSEADKKIDYVIESVRSKTPPDRACSDSLTDCAFSCPYRKVCFGLKAE